MYMPTSIKYKVSIKSSFIIMKRMCVVYCGVKKTDRAARRKERLRWLAGMWRLAQNKHDT